ncbi:MAG TPA: hypothetical protein DCF33_16950 [Saprospirales bacterium]|nr:hypothetical protein [Saprospirales bacterium]
MKHTLHLLLLFFLMGIQTVTAQQHDRYWLGRQVDWDTIRTTVLMRFDGDSIVYSSVHRDIQIQEGVLAMSDKAGNLQFYTNGNVVVSHNHQIMEGGKGFNEGAEVSDFIGGQWGDTTLNLAYLQYTYQLIPDGFEEHIYYMIHSFLEYSYIGWYWNTPRMQISKIDMSANGGKGRVVYKNRYFDEEPSSPFYATVRHGNGRDWWVILRTQDGLRYRSLLFERDEVKLEVVSTLPELSSEWFTLLDSLRSNGNLFFASEDGSRLLDNYGERHVKLMSFDRCSGMISLLDTIDTGIYPVLINGNIYERNMFAYELSPSGRYLYGVGDAGYMQWDLEAADVEGSRMQLGGPPWQLDSYQNPLVGILGGYFVFSYGPDGKLYNLFRNTHSVVEYPDERGEESEFCLAADNPPSCLQVPYNLYSSRHPNFRLGPLPGSGCDSLLSGVQLIDSGGSEFEVQPNPARDKITLRLNTHNQQGDWQVQVFNMSGALMQQNTLAATEWAFSVQDWPSGMYVVRLMNGPKVLSQTFVVQYR